MSKKYLKSSLRIWHPTIPAQGIYPSINLELVRQWSCGEPRTTPKGTPLSGVYKETYCCFDLINNASQDLSVVLRSANEELQRSGELIREVVATGGRIEYYVSLSGGMGFEFDGSLISELSELKISLAVEAI
ncbi:hypothetical protein [Pseudomonas citronellolis]|uniref:hypothetical protein n=1 Tax=Pseudomonas citronellolis TaxID=53408 RepID=UPI00106573EE|nr:hypothetical protein [Pseudomonas humi]